MKTFTRTLLILSLTALLGGCAGGIKEDPAVVEAKALAVVKDKLITKTAAEKKIIYLQALSNLYYGYKGAYLKIDGDWCLFLIKQKSEYRESTCKDFIVTMNRFLTTREEVSQVLGIPFSTKYEPHIIDQTVPEKKADVTEAIIRIGKAEAILSKLYKTYGV